MYASKRSKREPVAAAEAAATLTPPAAGPPPLEALTPALDTPADDLQSRISREVNALGSMGIDELRSRWRSLFRKPAPSHLTRWLLHRIIAYRIQANAFGDLDNETVRFLDQVAADYVRRRDSGERRPKAVPPVPPVLDRRRLKPGAILVREHAGALERVTVMDEGYAWNGKTYSSLSKVAFAITGTKWNGPRFFGLRDRKMNGVASDAGANP